MSDPAPPAGQMSRIAPSQTSPWEGRPAAGSRWTRQQLDTLKDEGVANPELVATATVTLLVTEFASWSAPAQHVPLVVPRLARSRSGRSLVVAPAGDKIWIRAT